MSITSLGFGLTSASPTLQDFSRRGALAYAGAALGFMMTGASAGWVLANNRAGENGNFSGAAQSEIG